jgi:hypothetical protein
VYHYNPQVAGLMNMNDGKYQTSKPVNLLQSEMHGDVDPRHASYESLLRKFGTIYMYVAKTL